MQFAVQVSYITGRNWHRLLSGGGIVAVFLTIRLAQLATPGVLLVEFLVAAAILLSAWIARRIGVLDDRNRVVADALGSLVALAGLLL